jgi:hypothetical protein
MKTSLSFLAALLLIVPALHARIGETPEQTDARYGPPNGELPAQSDRETIRHYFIAGFEIAVSFVDGKSAQEKFYKLIFSKEEIQTILDANKGAGKWHEQKPGWLLRGDDTLGNLSTILQLQDPTHGAQILIVTSPAYKDYLLSLENIRKTSEEKALSRF